MFANETQISFSVEERHILLLRKRILYCINKLLDMHAWIQVYNESIHTWLHVHRDYIDISANDYYLIKIFIFLREDTILVQLQAQIEKGRCTEKH